MHTETQTERILDGSPISEWSLAQRVAFRFCFVYFGLYCVSTQIITNLVSQTQGIDIPDPATLWPMRELVFWTAANIFHVKATLSYGGNSASGDSTFGWVLAFCLLVIAVLTTVIWSVLDSRRANYVTLHKWFRVFIRFCLAGQMLNYGMAKVIPVQMPFPYFTTLLQPYGTFAPMRVLWNSIGASPAYEVFAGCAEVAGGLFLFIPRTATLGALICLGDMIQVFTLNMTYDVSVELFSFHLILLSLFLVASDAPRLVNVLFLDRTAAPSGQEPLFRTPRANRIGFAAQILLGLWLIGMNVYGARGDWYRYGGGAPKSPLYGIWDVSEMSVDEQVRLPLLTDSDRWRRVIFDAPGRMTFQRVDDSFASYGSKIDISNKTVVLTRPNAKDWRASFTFQQPTPDQLILDGEIDTHKIHMLLQLMDRNKFPLVRMGFRWIQE
jgi:hypothetical protein